MMDENLEAMERRFSDELSGEVEVRRMVKVRSLGSLALSDLQTNARQKKFYVSGGLLSADEVIPNKVNSKSIRAETGTLKKAEPPKNKKKSMRKEFASYTSLERSNTKTTLKRVPSQGSLTVKSTGTSPLSPGLGALKTVSPKNVRAYEQRYNKMQRMKSDTTEYQDGFTSSKSKKNKGDLSSPIGSTASDNQKERISQKMFRKLIVQGKSKELSENSMEHGDSVDSIFLHRRTTDLNISALRKAKKNLPDREGSTSNTDVPLANTDSLLSPTTAAAAKPAEVHVLTFVTHIPIYYAYKQIEMIANDAHHSCLKKSDAKYSWFLSADEYEDVYTTTMVSGGPFILTCEVSSEGIVSRISMTKKPKSRVDPFSIKGFAEFYFNKFKEIDEKCHIVD